MINYKIEKGYPQTLGATPLKDGVLFAFESETKFHIGQKFSLELIILNQKISLTGKVVRICEGVFYPLYGVEIIDGDSKNLDFFRRYIDYSLN